MAAPKLGLRGPQLEASAYVHVCMCARVCVCVRVHMLTYPWRGQSFQASKGCGRVNGDAGDAGWRNQGVPAHEGGGKASSPSNDLKEAQLGQPSNSPIGQGSLGLRLPSPDMLSSQVQVDDDDFMHIRVYESLPHTNKPLALTNYQTHKARHDELAYF